MRRFLAVWLPAGLVLSAGGVLAAVSVASIFVFAAQAAGAEAAKPAAASAPATAEGSAPVPAAASAPKAAAAVPAPPPKGSQVPREKNQCIACHGEPDVWDAEHRRLYISLDKLKLDVHWLKGVNCHDCHGGNYQTDKPNEAHAAADGFRSKPADVKKVCVECHMEQWLGLVKGVHAKEGPKNERGESAPLACDQCHGTVAHELAPVRDPSSPVFLDHQLKTCGGCHPKYLETYLASVHGQGLEKMGLLVVPACADCHGAHGIYHAKTEPRATLSATRVAQTCGKCHRFIEERLAASVHGRGNGPGGLAARDAPGAREAPGSITNRRPSCTSCHVGHDLPLPTSAAFRQQMSDRCGSGNCHAGLSSQYAMSIHGELTELGYAAAAKCSDCHGAHDILPPSEAASRLSAENRAATCRQCHANTVKGFLSFDPHADYTDAQRSPIPHLVYTVLLTLLLTVFGLFGIHSVLWFARGLVDVLRNGRPGRLEPGKPAIVRFPRFHRIGHAVMLIAFLGLALTGLPLKYSHTDWAQGVARALGGFASTSFWHRVFALVTFACFIAYLVRLAWLYREARRRGERRSAVVFGPDSPIPNLHDAKDIFAMLRWFFGLGPKPTFDRWAYWEKFDFWGAAGDIVIIGSTGLMLWFPNFFCKFLPGTWLNVAQVIHSTQALLATGFVFAVHFFNTHLRPDIFPVDKSVLTGLVSEEEFRDTRPELFERLRSRGQLDAMRTTAPGRRTLWLVTAAGYTALGVGLALLVGMVVAGLGG
jgi:cytochrome b subunit of formate dehydrogenase